MSLQCMDLPHWIQDQMPDEKKKTKKPQQLRISIQFLKRCFIHGNKSTFTWSYTTLTLLREPKQIQLLSPCSMLPYQVYNPDWPATDREDQLCSEWKGEKNILCFFTWPRFAITISLNNIYVNVSEDTIEVYLLLNKNILLDPFDLEK